MALKETNSALGYEQITSLSTVKSLTLPERSHNGAPNFALIQAETQDVRWRDDGTDPTSSVGMKLSAGAELRYDGDLTQVKFIEVTSGAKLNISYYN